MRCLFSDDHVMKMTLRSDVFGRLAVRSLFLIPGEKPDPSSTGMLWDNISWL